MNETYFAAMSVTVEVNYGVLLPDGQAHLNELETSIG
jgi:hypothetical protein